MTPEFWRKVEEVFESALACPPAGRAAFLERACDGDAELRRQVEMLLASDESAGTFLESPALASAPSEIFKVESSPSLVGLRIGAYRIVREVGRGGMGAVYLAVRADDEFQKRVAIKLIRRGMDTDYIIRRFRNERQIVASLDHPYIARLLDGGTTEDGLPYFVMEFVEGVPLHQYCETHKLPNVERLQLFRKICEAVHYAHQNLIIHRDIKPSNILVTADGTPKLLDFGIAKILNPDIASAQLDPTTAVLRMMTPEYASPEQVRGESATAVSDVYSLGVLLYELLTGHRPYRLRSRLPAEIARAVCEEEPERPSVVVNEIEVLEIAGAEPLEITPETVSRARSTTPDQLRRQLSGSLDHVVLKALRKEPQKRYASVEELSADIRRYLDGLPVSAPSPYTTATDGVGVTTEEPSTSGRSIAVLPFKVLHGEEKNDEFLGMGMADAIIMRLSNIDGIIVRPTSTVIKYFDGEHNLLTAGHELNVGYVLDGRVQRIGDRVRVTVQLVRMRDGAPLWAEKFDEKNTDIFAVEDSISQQVAQALMPRLTGEECEPLHRRATQDAEVPQAYQNRQFDWNNLAPTRHLSHESPGNTGQAVAPRETQTAPTERIEQETAPHTADVDAARVEESARLARERSRSLRAPLWAAAGLLLLALAGAGVYLLLKGGRTQTPFLNTQSVKLTTTGSATNAAISPDGKYLAYVVSEGGKQGLWLRQVTVANNVRIVPAAEVSYSWLTFSPDGVFIYYALSDGAGAGALYQVPALGGSVKKLTEGIIGPAALSPDGKRLAYVRANSGSGEETLMVSDVNGTNERRVTSRKFPERLSPTAAPAWSPDGESIAFAFRGPDADGFYTKVVEARVADGVERPLNTSRWLEVNRITWLPWGGFVIIAQSEDSSFLHLWHLAPGGEPHRITNDLNDYLDVSATSDGASLVTVQRQSLINIWTADLNDPTRPTQLTSGAGRYFDLSWTPDGKLLYASDASGGADIWEIEANGAEQKQLTAGAGRNYAPVATPDGRHVVFHSNRTGAWNIWRMNRDGSDPVQLTTSSGDSNWPQVSPDGRWVVYEHTGSGTPASLWRVPVEGGTPTRLTNGLTIRPAISPDGKSIASWYRDDKPNSAWQVAILPFEGGEPLKTLDLPQSSASGNTGLRWTLDGSAIAYIHFRDGVTNVWLLPLDGAPPKPLTSFTNDLIYSFDWARDNRLVFSRGLRTSDVLLIEESGQSSRR